MDEAKNHIDNCNTKWQIIKFSFFRTYPDDLNETYARAVIDQLAAFWSPDVIYKLRDLENIEKLLKYNGLNVETAAKKLIFSCEEIILRYLLVKYIKIFFYTSKS